jgi:protein-S-isoprenylcysteine O-methyltransferase Ste14
MMILTGVLCLLPTLFSVLMLVLHAISSVIKASDEEAYLMNIHGDEYKEYYSDTGRFLPKIFR